MDDVPVNRGNMNDKRQNKKCHLCGELCFGYYCRKCFRKNRHYHLNRKD